MNAFPQGLALGKNFCNRITEQEHLTNNIKTARATLITSPRRFGKTSLVLNVIHNLKLPYSHIDLYSDINELDAQNTILSGIGDALYLIESAPKKAIKFVTDFFADLSVSFSFDESQVRVEFSKAKKSPAKIILTALKKLDSTLEKRKKKAILFFDEFQRIRQISESIAIEASLRNIAQKSKYISFVFSGSNRHLLNQTFDDSSKPLYKLCDRIVLDRIAPKDYEVFIQNKARLRWRKMLNIEVIEEIFSFSERHPYYLNVLCHKLWLNENIPTYKDVLRIWNRYTQEEKSDVLSELELLSSNQTKMLIAIAKYGDITSPLSKEFFGLTNFSPSSASQAVTLLEKRDYLYINRDNKYCILDPLIHYIFSHT